MRGRKNLAFVLLLLRHQPSCYAEIASVSYESEDSISFNASLLQGRSLGSCPVCAQGYVDITNCNANYWSCGSSCVGGQYWADKFCSCACVLPIPSALPLPIPSAQPTLHPSMSPSLHPSMLPLPAPTVSPTLIPTVLPLPIPSAQPTLHPSMSPSLHPSMLPVPAPTMNPTLILTARPSSSTPTVSSSTQADGSSSGTCYHHTSSATRLATNGKSADQVPMTNLKEGDRILALDEHAKPLFAKIEAIPNGPSAEPFIHIMMTGKGKQGLKATLHHTFDTCVGEQNPFMHAVESYGSAVVKAKDIKAGDCLYTADGRRFVRSATSREVQEGDVTYSIKLADRISAVAIGGVFTHAMGHIRNKYRTPIPEEHEHKKKKISTKGHV